VSLIYKSGVLVIVLAVACITTLYAAVPGDKPPRLQLNPKNISLSAPSREVITKKVTDKITVKINPDLFSEGVQLQTGYGTYFANLMDTNALDLKFDARALNQFEPKRRTSLTHGGLRLGGYVWHDSKVFLRVGYQSENFGSINTLKTPILNGFNSGYWKTSFATGIGVEYDFTKKWSLQGEATTVATPKNFTKDRDNRLMVRMKYLFE
jgi:opacity protein-like surface antigen